MLKRTHAKIFLKQFSKILNSIIRTDIVCKEIFKTFKNMAGKQSDHIVGIKVAQFLPKVAQNVTTTTVFT